MPIRIRLRRAGRRKRPFYHIVVADSRAPRDGRFIEKLGYYDPIPDPAVVEVKSDRVIYWLEQGAEPSETVYHLLKKKGIFPNPQKTEPQGSGETEEIKSAESK